MVDVIAKTMRKMSSAGLDAAMALDLGDDLCDLLMRAARTT